MELAVQIPAGAVLGLLQITVNIAIFVNAGLEGYAGGYWDIFHTIVFHDHLGSLAGGRVIRLGRRHDTYGSQGRNDHHRRQ